MDKYRQPQLDDESPALDGPDYVALVIEWDDLADTLGLGAPGDRGTAAARSPGMSTPDNGPGWNRVDQASMDSFPASDPPAWGSSHAVADAATPEDISDAVTSPFRPIARMGRVRRIALGISAVVALLSMIEGLRRIRRRYA
jgi:hypothetical protein